MDEAQIDNLARSLGSRLSRRSLGGIATGALAALGAQHSADAKKKTKKKKKKGVPGGGGGNTCKKQCSNRDCGGDGCGGSCGTCQDNKQCVSGTCESYTWKSGKTLSFLDYVQKIVTDSAGTIYIKDFLGAVNVRPQNGASSTFYTQGTDIWGMATDNTKLYFTNYDTNKVRLYSMAGVYDSQWGTSGTAAGQLNQPGALAAGGGYVFVQDWVGDDARLQRFDAATGNNPLQIAPPPGGLGEVGDMTYDSGEFFVTDDDKNLVYRYSEGGGYLGTIGGGSGKGKLSGVFGVTVDHRGQVLVTDGVDYRVVVYKKTGEFVTEIEYVGDEYETPVSLATFGDFVYVIFQEEDRHLSSIDTYEAVGGASREPRTAPEPKRQRERRQHGGKQGR